MLKLRNRALLLATLAIVTVLTALAGLCIGAALAATRLARRALRDRLTCEGNRLFRLSQRLDDALTRLDAAMTICVKERI